MNLQATNAILLVMFMFVVCGRFDIGHMSYISKLLFGIFSRIKSSPLANRMASGAFWSLSGVFISRGLGLLASVLVARMLGKEGFGEFGVIQSTVAMFGVFAGFGLGLTASKYVAEYRLIDPPRVGRIIAMSNLFALGTGGGITVFILVFSSWMSSSLLAAPHLTGLMQVAGIIIFFNALNGAQTGALAGFEAFRAIARVNLTVGLLTFPLMVGGVYFAGLRGAVFGLVASMAVSWMLNHRALRVKIRESRIKLDYRFCGNEKNILWKFSLPAMLGGVLIGPVNWACNAFLVNQPNGYAEMGLFSAASQWRVAVLVIPAAVGSVVLPILSSLYQENSWAKYIKVLFFNIGLNLCVTFIIAAPVVFFSQNIMEWYGKNFIDGKIVLVLMVLSGVVIAVNNLLTKVVASIGKMWAGFFFDLAWGCTYLIFGFYLSKSYGAKGLAVGILTASILQFFVQTVYVYKIIAVKKSEAHVK